MKRLIALAAFGLGYVLGAQAGRERYEQLKRGFRRVREDPRVQEQAHHVADVAKERAPQVVDKVSSAASSAVHKVHGSTLIHRLDGDGSGRLPGGGLGRAGRVPGM